MNAPGKIWLSLTILLGGLASGCGPAEPGESPTLPAGQREALQARVYHSFTNGLLFKPAENDLESPLLVRLAPLIIQEVTDPNPATLWRDQFALPDFPPQVIGASAITTISNRPHHQFTYTWRYPAGNSPTQTGRAAQGVRLTLNAAAAPVIWEVLEDSTGAEIIYVAQSLEQAARAELGPPLPGRKFAIERSLTETPNVVVANVIEDGPIAMGPIVYLRSASRDVTALICRCMPSQIHTLAGQKDYLLEQNPRTENRSEAFPQTPLHLRLRLPSQF